MTSSGKLIAVTLLALAALAARAEHASSLAVPYQEGSAPRSPSWPDEHRRAAPVFADEPVATFGSTLRPGRRAGHGGGMTGTMPTASGAPTAPTTPVAPAPRSTTASSLALTYAPPVDIAIPASLMKSNQLGLDRLRSATVGAASIPSATVPTGAAISALGATGGFSQMTNYKTISAPASGGDSKGGDAKGGGEGGGQQSPLEQVYQIYQAATGNSIPGMGNGNDKNGDPQKGNGQNGGKNGSTPNGG